jgi:hypothetical protein
MALYNGFCVVKPYYSMPTLLVQICIRVSAIPHAYTVYCIITDIFTYTYICLHFLSSSALQRGEGGAPAPLCHTGSSIVCTNIPPQPASPNHRVPGLSSRQQLVASCPRETRRGPSTLSCGLAILAITLSE